MFWLESEALVHFLKHMPVIDVDLPVHPLDQEHEHLHYHKLVEDEVRRVVVELSPIFFLLEKSMPIHL